MTEKTGIKDTLDFVNLGLAIAKALKRQLGDGFQLSDLASLALTSDFQKTFLEAVSGAGNVPAEVQDLSGSEAIALIRFVTDKVADYLEDQPAAA
ncbi:hypothetical protein [Oligoflexus tunisiensis]|uniref:hypothetical protein n=1 Tax=Oligoflexus tunisiensis TaxID=708132 RepID=UPI00114CF28C|nr:hypothetical protein [Oligoflexus tunisiensis]